MIIDIMVTHYLVYKIKVIWCRFLWQNVEKQIETNQLPTEVTENQSDSSDILSNDTEIRSDATEILSYLSLEDDREQYIPIYPDVSNLME